MAYRYRTLTKGVVLSPEAQRKIDGANLIQDIDGPIILVDELPTAEDIAKRARNLLVKLEHDYEVSFGIKRELVVTDIIVAMCHGMPFNERG